jgi:hypothetical protein
MKNFYHLHVQALIGFDRDTINFSPIVLENVGLEIDSWPSDDIFAITPLFFVTERLRSIFVYEKFTGLRFDKVDRITQGANFLDNYPNTQLPPYYWQLTVDGNCMEDDFSLWQGIYPIVSERCLECLRHNHVTRAESDLIDEPVEAYFSGVRKYFWMSENAKAYFMKKQV